MEQWQMNAIGTEIDKIYGRLDRYYETAKRLSEQKACIEAAETGGDYTTETKNEFWRLSVEQLELSKYRPPVACWPEIEEAISTAVTQAIQGEKAPKEALNAAAALANQLLEEEAKTRK